MNLKNVGLHYKNIKLGAIYLDAITWKPGSKSFKI